MLARGNIDGGFTIVDDHGIEADVLQEHFDDTLVHTVIFDHEHSAPDDRRGIRWRGRMHFRWFAERKRKLKAELRA